MRPLWRDRIRTSACRWFGHREASDSYVVYCQRCRVLLRRADRMGVTP